MNIPAFRAITGHGEVIRHLRNAIASDRISHAYLITGEAGSGKRTMADALAAALVCTSPTPDHDACGECLACRKLRSHNHQDVIRIEHEKPGVITVDEVRSQLVGTIGLRPGESGRKVYIVPDAEKMNPQAQNAILKTIEEPPSYAVIILLAESEEALLPTILSRCVRLPLMPLADRLVRDYLERELQLPDYEARILTAAAQGSIGKAVSLASDEAVSERRREVLSLLARLPSLNTAETAQRAQHFKEEKEHMNEILDTMLLFYRDVYVIKTGGRDDSLVLYQEAEAIREAAGAMSYSGLLHVTEELDRARVRIGANVNPELTMEVLLLAIRSAMKGNT
ncbi:MAG: DNA polymerase III subunit delta' [Lachnospiraceae bacterium]|nr:DNA polymerase III subunit delta' [Lachnospiraceae bacterium]